MDIIIIQDYFDNTKLWCHDIVNFFTEKLNSNTIIERIYKKSGTIGLSQSLENTPNCDIDDMECIFKIYSLSLNEETKDKIFKLWDSFNHTGKGIERSFNIKMEDNYGYCTYKMGYVLLPGVKKLLKARKNFDPDFEDDKLLKIGDKYNEKYVKLVHYDPKYKKYVGSVTKVEKSNFIATTFIEIRSLVRDLLLEENKNVLNEMSKLLQ